MKKVIVDAVLRKKLLGLQQPLEICDEAGRVLGRILPLQPHLTEAELQRREQEVDYPTADVIAYLKKQGV